MITTLIGVYEFIHKLEFALNELPENFVPTIELKDKQFIAIQEEILNLLGEFQYNMAKKFNSNEFYINYTGRRILIKRI